MRTTLSATYPSLGPVWRDVPVARASFAVCALLLGAAFHRGLADLVAVWDSLPEYSYGYAIAPVAAYLFWQKRAELARERPAGSWWGAGLVALGLAGLLAGQIATLGTVVQYSFLVALAGVVLSYLGPRGFGTAAAPLSLLLFMVPLPNYLLIELSQALQLLSTQLGVGVIRALGVSVFMEGNVIDLGTLRLQVVEACNGLRYLFPLTALAYICALAFRAPLWKRVVLVASAAPLTVLMNSFRIGLIGVMAEYWGKGAAEGVLHDFEGWIVFMACAALLALEMWLLAGRRPLGEILALDGPAAPAGGAHASVVPRPYAAACALLAFGALAALLAPAPAHVVPQRQPFSEFPHALDEWQGKPGRLEVETVQALKLDDYLLADYQARSAPSQAPVNLYVAYYASQANGASVHSPRACIPGDGWEIERFEARSLAVDAGANGPLRVNRVLIRKGDSRQLVYYWFQQRGRYMTGEYDVKLRILQDAFMRNRTDGAVVRLVARVRPDEPVAAADAQLEQFARTLVGRLAPYVPG